MVALEADAEMFPMRRELKVGRRLLESLVSQKDAEMFPMRRELKERAQQRADGQIREAEMFPMRRELKARPVPTFGLWANG